MNNMNDETTDATPKEVKHGGVFLEALNACDYQRRNGNTWTAEINSIIPLFVNCLSAFAVNFGSELNMNRQDSQPLTMIQFG